MVQPKIGQSMLYSLGEPFNRMVEHLATVKTRYIEIVDDGLHTLDKKRVSDLKQAAKSYDLIYTVHSPFADMNIATPSKPILSAFLRRLKQSLSFASELDATLFVLHPGLASALSMFYPGKDWEQNVKSIKELYRFSENLGVKAALENLPEKYGFVMKNVDDFTKFYNETGLDISIVLDTGHANLHGQLEPFLQTFPDRIVQIHASDNMGDTDQHLGIGYGNIDWAKFVETLKKIEYSGTLITESVFNVEESTQKLKQFFA
jgi:sugar phosphate isomerase/epimerase